MSNSVWYLSFRNKKISLEEYPNGKKPVKKVKKKPKKSLRKNKLTGFFFTFLFLFTLILFSSLVSAEPINDTFHLNLQTTYSNGSIETGTFVFDFNITENSNESCLGPVVYNYSTSVATDSRGIVSIYLPTAGDEGNLSTLNYDQQYYLCL